MAKPLLEKLRIPLVVENPNVGENLQDHPNTGVSFEVADGVKTKVCLSRQEPEAINEAMQDYINRKRGVANIFTYAACGSKSPPGLLLIIYFLLEQKVRTDLLTTK